MSLTARVPEWFQPSVRSEHQTSYPPLVSQEKKALMGKRQPDMIKGTLDMLILKVLSLEPMHGWGVSERIQLISKDELQVNQGSLYGSLYRLTREGWIRSSWQVTENNRKARYYALTRAGERQLGIEAENWDRLATAVARIMTTT